MRMTILMWLMIMATPVFAYEQDTSLTMLEGLVAYKGSEQSRIEKFLVKQKVMQPKMYAKIICQELPNPVEQKLFAVKLVKETRGKASAVSSAGARGPWQTMPGWIKLFKVKHPTEPRTNLKLAIRVYRIHLAESKGKVWGHRGAVWRYSGGSDIYVADAARLIKTV